MGNDLEEFNKEKEEYIEELNILKNEIDLDYFNLDTEDKKDLNKLLDIHINFLSNVGNEIYDLKYKLNNNKLNKQERKEIEDKANRILLFFIEELEERSEKLTKEINKYIFK
jgi:hypothetical protein